MRAGEWRECGRAGRHGRDSGGGGPSTRHQSCARDGRTRDTSRRRHRARVREESALEHCGLTVSVCGGGGGEDEGGGARDGGVRERTVSSTGSEAASTSGESTIIRMTGTPDTCTLYESSSLSPVVCVRDVCVPVSHGPGRCLLAARALRPVSACRPSPADRTAPTQPSRRTHTSQEQVSRRHARRTGS